MKRHLIKTPILILILVLAWTLFPIYWMVSMAVRDAQELRTALSFWPKSFTLNNFIAMFSKSNFGVSITNSLRVTLLSLVFALVIGLCCSYIIARIRYRYRFRRPLLFWILLVRILPPIAFALPLYIMMNRLGVLGTRIPLVLAHVLINLPFVVWFMISFFANGSNFGVREL